MITKKCAYCGNIFHTDRKCKQFCSNTCHISYMKSNSIKNRTSKCLNCGKEFIAKCTQNTKFCSSKCSGLYNGKKHRQHTTEEKERISQKLKKYFYDKIKKDKTCRVVRVKNTNFFKIKKVCKICGQFECSRPDVCKQYLIRKKSTNLSRMGFDFSKLGSVEIYDEYDKLKDYIINQYIVHGKSLIEICREHNMTCETSLCKIMDMYQINRRDLQTALLNCILHNRMDYSNFVCEKFYKHGYHTSWDGVKFLYRSSYELDYAKKLDSQKTIYRVENIRIPYFDTIKKCYRVSIPDFYLPQKNLIIEIKSDFTYDRQNMIDRFKSYKKYGYDYQLVIEGKNVGKKLPKNIKRNYRYYNKN